MPSPTDKKKGHADREHAPFAPSSAEIWLNCPAAVPLTELCEAAGMVDPAGAYAEAGTLGHEVAEIHLKRGVYTVYMDLVPQATIDRWDQLGEDPASYLAAVDVYLQHVLSLRQEIGEGVIAAGYAKAGADALLESRVQVHGKEVWGSIDYAIAEFLGTLHVIDLKLGSGKLVSPVENQQLLTYAVGLLAKYPACEEVTLHIVQPRVPISRGAGSPTSSWTTTPEEVKAHLKRIKKAVKAARATGSADQAVLGDHCRWCKGKALCKAQRGAALAVLDGPVLEPVVEALPTGFPATQAALSTVSPTALSEVLDTADRVREFLDAVEAYCLSNPPPGWKVVEGQSRRKWIGDEAKVAEALAERGADPWRQQLITIGAAEKAIGKGNLPEWVVEKPPGAPKLVREDDPRPAREDPLRLLP